MLERRRKFWTALFALSLITSPGGSAAESAQPENPELELFQNPARAIRIYYPKGWHVLESKEQYPYTVTIEPTPPIQESVSVPLTLEIFKFFHLSTSPLGGAGGPDPMEPYFQSVMKIGGGAKLIERKEITIQGTAGRRIEIEAVDNRNPTVPLRMFVAAAVKNNTLAAVFCQTPAGDFEKHRALFEAVLSRLEPFSSDAQSPDNDLLYQETVEMEKEAIAALTTGDVGKGLDLYQRILAINPWQPSHRMNYGTFLFQLAKGSPGQLDPEVLGQAEQQLQIGFELLSIENDPSTQGYRAHILYLLGDALYYGHKDQAKAKQLYEEALRLHPPHTGAQEALKRYKSS